METPNVLGIKMSPLKGLELKKHIVDSHVDTSTMTPEQQRDFAFRWLEKSYRKGDKVIANHRPAVILQIFPADDVWNCEVQYRNGETSIELVVDLE